MRKEHRMRQILSRSAAVATVIFVGAASICALGSSIPWCSRAGFSFSGFVVGVLFCGAICYLARIRARVAKDAEAKKNSMFKRPSRAIRLDDET